MYELIFKIENEELLAECNYKNKNGSMRTKQVKTDKALQLIEELEKQPKIKNICFDGKDLTFKVDKIKIRLIDRIQFRRDLRFKFIFEYINQKRYKKSDKKITTGIISVALVIVTVVTGSVITKNIKDGKDKLPPEEPSSSSSSTTEDSDTIDIDIEGYGSFTDSIKFKNTKLLYGETIEKYCNMYGLDSNVLCAIATQERGTHSSKVDKGGAIGLFQIQVSIWDNQYIEVYNEEKECYEKIHITLENLKDEDFNIQVGCAIFQKYLNIMQGNYYATMMCYNMGEGTARKIIRQYAKDTNRTFDEVLADVSDLGWLEYTKNYNGDPQYVQHVVRYIEEGRIKT